MVFQYNPLIHYLEVNDVGEVICTVSRLDLLSPRIRYNVHDAGGVVEFAHVRDVLAEFGFDLDATRTGPGGRGPARSAAVVAADPAAVPVDPRPARRDDQRHGLEHLPRGHRDASSIATRLVVPRLHSFMLSVVDDERGTPRPTVALELTDLEGVDDAWRAQMADQLRDGLAGLNIDYRSSIAEFPAAMQPIVVDVPRSAPVRSPPMPTRIKQRRIVRPSG